MRTLATTVTAALLLVGAAPALAVTGGYGIARSLKTKPLPITIQQTSKHTFSVCDLSDTSSTKNKRKPLPKRFSPVACEQPPRSTPNIDLKHATPALGAIR
jgi:hypothetical protein